MSDTSIYDAAIDAFEPDQAAQPAQPTSIYDAAIDEMDAEEERKDLQLAELAKQARTATDDRQTVLQVATTLGTPVSQVQKALPAWKEAAAAKEFNAREWRTKNPEMYKLLTENPDVGPVAMQDQKLSEFTKLARRVDLWKDNHPWLTKLGQAMNPLSMGPGGLDVLNPALALGVAATGLPELPEKPTAYQSVEGKTTAGMIADTFSRSRDQSAIAALGTQLHAVDGTIAEQEALAAKMGTGETEYLTTLRGVALDLRVEIADKEAKLGASPDYGENQLQRTLLDATEGVASQVDSWRGLAGGAAVGAAVGGVGALAVTKSPTAAASAAKEGARIGAMLGTFVSTYVAEAGGDYLQNLKTKDESGKLMDPAVARTAATISGVAKSLVESGETFGLGLGSLGAIGEIIKKGAQAKGALELAKTAGVGFAEFGKAAAGEGAEEFLQAWIGSLSNYVGSSASAGKLQEFNVTEMQGDAYEAAWKGFVGGIGVGAGQSVAGKVGNAFLGLTSHAIGLDRSRKAAAQVQGILELAQSPTAKVAPKAVAKMVKEQTAAGRRPVTELWLDPVAFAQVAETAGHDPRELAVELFGEKGPAMVQKALASRKDSDGQRATMEISLESWLGKVGQHPMAMLLVGDMTAAPRAMTSKEMGAADTHTKEEIKVRKEQILAEHKTKGPWVPKTEAESALVAAIDKSLERTGTQDLTERESTVAQARAVVETLSQRANIPADDLFALYAVKIDKMGAATTEDTDQTPATGEDTLAMPEGITDTERKLREHYTGLDQSGRIHAYYTDTITGLLNERGDTTIEHDAARPIRARFGAEGFKLTNDVHGHLAGDGVFKVMANVIKRHIPDGAKLGGDIEGDFATIEAAQAAATEMEQALDPEGRIKVTVATTTRTDTREETGKALGASYAAIKGARYAKGEVGHRKAPPRAFYGEAAPKVKWDDDHKEGLDEKDPAVAAWLAAAGEQMRPMADAWKATERGDLVDMMPEHDGEFTSTPIEDAFTTIAREASQAYTGAGFDMIREVAPKAHVASSDMRGIKEGNAAFGEEGMNEVLRLFNAVMMQAGGNKLDFAHPHGDENYAQHDDPKALARFFEKARRFTDRLLLTTDLGIDKKTGKHRGYVLQKGVSFEYGVGTDIDSAERELNNRKPKQVGTSKPEYFDNAEAFVEAATRARRIPGVSWLPVRVHELVASRAAEDRQGDGRRGSGGAVSTTDQYIAQLARELVKHKPEKLLEDMKAGKGAAGNEFATLVAMQMHQEAVKQSKPAVADPESKNATTMAVALKEILQASNLTDEYPWAAIDAKFQRWHDGGRKGPKPYAPDLADMLTEINANESLKGEERVSGVLEALFVLTKGKRQWSAIADAVATLRKEDKLQGLQLPQYVMDQMLDEMEAQREEDTGSAVGAKVDADGNLVDEDGNIMFQGRRMPERKVIEIDNPPYRGGVFIYEDAVEKILKEWMENDAIDTETPVGLRVLADDQSHKIGARLKPSSVWDDGNPTDDKLDGSSAIALNPIGKRLTEEHIKHALGLLKQYHGKRVALVAGRLWSHGDDIGEVVLRDAKVIVSWERSEIFSDKKNTGTPRNDSSGTGGNYSSDSNEDVQFQPAWHGTPHRDIDKFSTQAIGTGEGAQVYGWGLYFAQQRDIAEWYRGKLSQKASVLFKGQKTRTDTPESIVASRIAGYYESLQNLRGKKPSIQEAFEEAKQDLHSSLRANKQHLEGSLEAAAGDKLASRVKSAQHVVDSLTAQVAVMDSLTVDDVTVSPAGQLYRVEIPEDSDLLDYDQPMSKQPAPVMAMLHKAGLVPSAEEVERLATASAQVAQVKRSAASLDTGAGVMEHALLEYGSKEVATARLRASLEAVEKDLLNQEASGRGVDKLDEHHRDITREALGLLDAMAPGRTQEWEAKAAQYIKARDIMESGAGTRLPNGERFSAEMRGSQFYSALTEGFGESKRGEHGAQRGDEWASKTLSAAGVRGLRYLDGQSRNAGEGAHNYVIWDEDTITIEETLYQGKGKDKPQPSKQNSRGWIQTAKAGLNKTFSIMLGDHSDLSTPLHELAHAYMEMVGDLSEQGDTPAQLKDDYAKILTFVGAESRKDLTSEQKEKFAAAWEAYLMEGKAPSVDLVPVFTRFRAWLLRIYKSVKGLADALGVDPGLNDDMRGVFDRLLATDEEIELMRKAAGVGAPMWASAEEAGMTEAEYNRYLTDQRDEQSRAALRVHREVTEAQKYVLTDEWKKEVRAAKKVAEEEYDRRRDVRAWRFMTKGEATNSAGVVNPDLSGPDQGLIDRKAAIDQLGKKNLIFKRLRGRLTPDGMTPREVAHQYGYKDEWEMWNEMAVLPINRTKWVREKAEEAARKNHPELALERERIDEIAQQAYHEEGTAESLIKEWVGMLRKGGIAGMPHIEAIRQAAAMMAEGMVVRRLSLGNAVANERRAAERTIAAAARGDFQEAAKQKEEQILQHLLYAELSKARKVRDQFEDLTSRLTNRKQRGELAKAGQEYLDASDTILEALGVKTRETDPEVIAERTPLLDALEALKADGIDLAADPNEIVNLVNAATNWKDLTVAELRSVRNALAQMYTAARDRNFVTINGERVAIEDLGQDIAMDAKERKDLGPAAGSDSAKTKGKVQKRGIRQTLQGIAAAMMEPEEMLRELGATAHRVLWELGYLKAREAEDALTLKVTAKVTEMWDNLPAELQKRRSELLTDLGPVQFPEDVNRDNASRDRMWMWMVALNLGNASNLERLLGGYAWDEAQVRQWLNRNMSEAEWVFVQSVWDLMDKELWPEVARAYREVNGIDPPKIQAVPFQTPHGVFRGGYFPARYDPVASRLGQAQSEEALTKAYGTQAGRLSVVKGFTKERAKKYSDVVSLQWSVVPAHVTAVIRYATHDGFVRNASRILTNGTTQRAIQRHLGLKFVAQLTGTGGWLPAVASFASDSIPAAIQDAMSPLQMAKSRMVMSSLGWSLTVAAGDLTNPLVSLAAGHISAPSLAAAALKTIPLATWPKTREEALAKSPELKHRAQNLTHLLRNNLSEIGRRHYGKASHLVEQVRDSAWFLFEQTDKMASTVIWQAAYRDGLRAKGATEESAVAHADEQVRRALPSHDPGEQPSLLRDKRGFGSVVAFYGYFNKLYNVNRGMFAEKSAPEAFARMVAIVLVANVLGEALSGRGPEEDEEMPEWVLRKALSAPFSMVPFVGALGEFGAGLATSKVFQGEAKARPFSMRAFPGASAVERLVKAITKITDEDRDTDQRIWDALDAAGVLAGLPIGASQVMRTGRYLTSEEGLVDDLDRGDVAGVASGLVYGERDNQPMNMLTPLRE